MGNRFLGVQNLYIKLNKKPQYSHLRRLTLSAKKLIEENEDVILPTGIILSSFDYPITGVESRWNINPSPRRQIFGETEKCFL